MASQWWFLGGIAVVLVRNELLRRFKSHFLHLSAQSFHQHTIKRAASNSNSDASLQAKSRHHFFDTFHSYKIYYLFGCAQNRNIEAIQLRRPHVIHLPDCYVKPGMTTQKLGFIVYASSRNIILYRNGCDLVELRPLSTKFGVS